MDLSDRLAIGRVLALATLWVAAAGGDAPADDPAPPPSEGPPVHIFLQTPNDLDALLRGLDRPDFRLQKGPAPVVPPSRPEAASPVVESVLVAGEVPDDLAHLVVTFGVRVEGDAPRWVSLRLDGQTLAEVAEADRPLPHRLSPEQGWQVELSGAGEHVVRAVLLVPIQLDAETRRLDLAIPEAATTRVELILPPGATTAPAAPVDIGPIEAGQQAKLRVSLSPRPRLDLSWRVSAGRDDVPPKLVAQGAIALDLDEGTMRANSSWLVRSERGVAERLVVELDPSEALLGVELDGEPIASGTIHAPGSGPITIPLATPLRPGSSRRLVLTTRRPLPSRSGEALTFRGYPIAEAVTQTGVLAIARVGDLWARGELGRGARQIDPRNDLPPDLRARPGTVLAYQFVEQPFELRLKVDPSPPWVRVDARTTVVVEATRARVETWLDYQVARGRAFQLQIGLPAGLELTAVGPETVVAASHERPPAAGETERVLTVVLTPRARDDGAFRVRLSGVQALATPDATVALFRPREVTARGGKVAVVAARNVAVEPREESPAEPAFAAAGPESLSDWPWPSERPTSSTSPSFWLRHHGVPGALALSVTTLARSVEHQTTLLAQLDRRRLELRQETAVEVRRGALSRLEVAVPPTLEGRWNVEGEEVAAREPLGQGTDGDRVYRLTLAREATGALRLRFRSRVPVEASLSSARPHRLILPMIRLLEGTAAPARAEVSAEASIRVVPGDDEGWGVASHEHGVLRLFQVPGSGGPASILATALAPVPLPDLIASRLWLRTVRAPEGTVRTTASYAIEAHGPTLDVALPTGAEWVSARVGADLAPEVQRLPQARGYRLVFPPGTSNGPIPVQLEYLVPARLISATWGPPRLLDGVVRQTVWEVCLPWDDALIGVPAGWSDENEWYWDRYVWKRRPTLDPAALSRWVKAPSAWPGAGPRVGDHAYLFSRPGEPEALRPRIASRALLVGIGSGTVLGLGLWMLARRGAGRIVVVTAPVLALAAVALAGPSVILLVLQSSALGVVLAVVAAGTQRFVHRRRAVLVRDRDPSGTSGPAGFSVGSDDSTFIRPRPETTVDHVASAPAATPESGP